MTTTLYCLTGFLYAGGLMWKSASVSSPLLLSFHSMLLIILDSQGKIAVFLLGFVKLYLLLPTRQEFWCYHLHCTCLHRKTYNCKLHINLKAYRKKYAGNNLQSDFIRIIIVLWNLFYSKHNEIMSRAFAFLISWCFWGAKQILSFLALYLHKPLSTHLVNQIDYLLFLQMKLWC